MDHERSRVTYPVVLTLLLLALGAALGWASHHAWVRRSNEALSASSWQVAWHGGRALFPFALLAGALSVLPRRQAVVWTLCASVALATSLGLVGYGAAARRYDREGRGRVEEQETRRRERPAHVAVPYWQGWIAALGAVAAATVARAPHEGRG